MSAGFATVCRQAETTYQGLHPLEAEGECGAWVLCQAKPGILGRFIHERNLRTDFVYILRDSFVGTAKLKRGDGMPDSNGKEESPLGKGYVGQMGLMVITAYLILFAIADFYFLIKVWPPNPEWQGWKINFAWCSNGPSDGCCGITVNTSLFLISMLSGALGSLLHALRSVYWYAGNRQLVWSWSVMYALLPFSGAVLAMIFYLIVRGGFLPQSTVNSTPYAFAAMGALVGLFSEPAVLKLKQVAETFFTKAQQGKDTVTPPPKLSSIVPTSGPAAGGTPVTITGTNFVSGAKVNIGGTSAVSVVVASATSITATTPQHAAGAADVEVVNPDDQKDALKGGFTYN